MGRFTAGEACEVEGLISGSNLSSFISPTGGGESYSQFSLFQGVGLNFFRFSLNSWARLGLSAGYGCWSHRGRGSIGGKNGV
jgi:hypothetical protein